MASRGRDLVLGLLVAASTVSAQTPKVGAGSAPVKLNTASLDAAMGSAMRVAADPPYDGRFDFARLSYAGTGCSTNEGPGWRHDYPAGERNLMRIMEDLTTLAPWTDSSGIFSPADPELMKHPVAYLSEPGCWIPSEAEVKGLRTYLLKGGFLIVDDFRGKVRWTNFATQMLRAIPEGRFVTISRSDPVFKLFFDVSELQVDGGSGAQFLGMYEDNNPKKRLLVLANYNTDIGDYWQWSASGRNPVDKTNQAYKLGVNYIIYGLTH
jgi:hypothetical protein